MFKVSYLDKNGNAQIKGGFQSDKAANDWIKEQGDQITAMRLLVWSEQLQSCRAVENFPAYKSYARLKGWI